MKDWFSWMEDDSLRAAADYVLNGGEFDQDNAKKALNLLREESVEQIKKRIGDEFYAEYYPTNRQGGRWKDGTPVGLVDHYTAGISARGTLRWFSSKPRGPGIKNSSAHVVLDRDGILYVVIDPLEKVAWHATWANKDRVGIEHINAGLLLRKTDKKIYYLESREYPEDRVKQVQKMGNKLWEPYTPAQLVANLVFKRWLIDAIPTMEEDQFTEHEDIDEDKKDCGPLWPLFELNDLVFSRKPVRGMDWQKKEVLGVEDVALFKQEVNDYLGIKPAVSPFV